MMTTRCGLALAVVSVWLPGVAAAWTDDMPVTSAGTTFLGGAADDQLGFAFAARCDLNGDGFGDLLVSAPLADGSGADRGAVYVYFDVSSFLGATHTAGDADLVIHGASDGDHAGHALDCQGDLDGDGYDDIAIGSPSASCGGTDVGAVYIVFGRVAGWGLSIDLSTADIELCGHDSFDQAGYGLSIVGDLDADGYDELAVGVPWAYLGSGQNGGAYLVYGTDRSSYPDTDLGDADAIFAGPTGSNAIGGAIAGVGDLDADGYADLAIGNAVEGGAWDGWTYVLLGGSSAWSGTLDLSGADASYVGVHPGDDAGNAVAGAGDVDGDGFDDLLIGAPYSDDGGSLAGQVYLVLGKATGWTTNVSLANADASFIGEDSTNLLGTSVSIVGDLDGDGFDDLALGAPHNGEYAYAAGQVYLFFGNASAWGMQTSVGTADTTIIGEATEDWLGLAVAGSGDWDGDGYDDLLIGAPYNDAGATGAGALYLVNGNQCEDQDGDGFGDPGDASCGGGANTDCDDQDDAVYPGASETCNGIDDDCDGGVPADEDDADGDGYRICDGDCDDINADVHPNASEICDGLDNDCDSAIPAWEEDEDGDGHLSCSGDCNDDDASLTPDDLDGDGASSCDGDCDDSDQAMNLLDEDADGFDTCDGDCDDDDDAIHPDAEEACDGVDSDCDGSLPDDEADQDGDGFMACADDCDDQDADIYPGAEDLCDGVDSDCDGVSEVTDSDGDGHASHECGGEDCDDEAPDIHPLADEACNDLVDNDCDGLVDDQDEECEQTDDDDTTPEDEVGEADPDEEPAGCECSAVGPDSHHPASAALLLGLAALWWRRAERWPGWTGLLPATGRAGTG